MRNFKAIFTNEAGESCVWVLSAFTLSAATRDALYLSAGTEWTTVTVERA